LYNKNKQRGEKQINETKKNKKQKREKREKRRGGNKTEKKQKNKKCWKRETERCLYKIKLNVEKTIQCTVARVI